MNSRDHSPETILIVDDDPHARLIHSEWLVHAGYRTLLAASGEAALALAREARPALVLVDLKMPGMDGWTLLDRLREDPLTRDTKVVALTIVGRGEDRRDPVRRGFDDHWVKPIAAGDLLGGTERLIGRPAA